MIETMQRVLSPEQWVNNYADVLYRYAYIRLGDSALAEDLVQETFLSAWKSRSTYNGLASEKNWLFTICKNKLVDHFRKLKSDGIKRDTHFFDHEDHWTIEAQPGNWTISELPLSKEFFEVLNRCRSKLNKSQFAVFSLRYLDEMDAKEICCLLDISMQNYWVLIHRAKLQLRECLQVNWIDL